MTLWLVGWFTGQSKKGVCIGKKVNCAPMSKLQIFMGKPLLKGHNAELMKVQAAVLGIKRPLASAWKELHEAQATEDTSATVPATEVMNLIQCTLCLVGNALENISQTRCAHILEHIEKSWSRYASNKFPDAKETLFADAFKSRLI